ncbi:HAMP domain-containing protein [Azospirillum sp. RWY-5-1]|uniref:histidine kinase n=1 Tax=Azospirillum oleiclasticum TaxID=2735135 RepID=A0ABX2TLA0_9PROT|nr:stimulus-sensing domain-containing protein [Azospirillum oleiclasticum]NYZ17870.1 HAMP domain-containing protein [Azospirillum oleiclasticum]NYZ25078.1 HAMP domain-containing protein [Azospirillum oleiclasticum]
MAWDTATARGERAADRAPRRHHRRGGSPLTLRILAVNVLALAILVGGLLYLGRYQDRLIQAELDALRTEARIFASALGEGAVRRDEGAVEETYVLQPELARQMVRRLVETTATRTRLFDPDGRLLSDSRVLVGSSGAIQIQELPPPDSGNPLSRAAADLYDRIVDILPSREAFPVYEERTAPQGPAAGDVERALAGEVASTVWRGEGADGRDGLMLTVAVPVQRYKEVLGAVLLSRAGTEIDAAIRSVRLDILKVFAVALAVTVLLSVYLAGTIARPIRRLAMAADRVRLGHGRHTDIPDFRVRGDEIGDLSGVLRDMTAALWTRMDAIERFAADVAHEIKNPLSSLRSAVETVNRVGDPDRRARLMAIIADDIQRMDRLISDISNASRLDAELSRAEPEPVDLGAMLRTLADIHATAAPEPVPAGGPGNGPAPDIGPPRVVVDIPAGEDLTVPGLEGRLTQVFQNLIANALSFSPPGGRVRLSARRTAGAVVAEVSDDGPGIPEGKETAIFERFYSERPAGEKFGTHSGLGLSISRQIVEAHEGSITAHNRRSPGGAVSGAVFTVRLPVG